MKITLTQYHFNRVGVETRESSQNALGFLEREYLLRDDKHTGWRVSGHPGHAKVYDSLGNLVAEAVVEKRGRKRAKATGMRFADPGYQPDHQPRYKLNNEEQVRAAWSYINHRDNAARYTAEQRRLIHQRIQAAGRRYGIQYGHGRTKGSMLGRTSDRTARRRGER